MSHHAHVANRVSTFHRPLFTKPNRQRSSKQAASAGIAALLFWGQKVKLKDDMPPDMAAWLQQRGLPQQKALVSDLPGYGRSLVARQRLPAAQPLLQIPEELLLSAATARHQSRIGHLMEDAALPAWSAIALYLIELRRNGGRGREELGLEAEWGPWLSVLPDRTGCVLDWSQQEINELLGGSPLHTSATEICSAFATSAEELQRLLADPRAAAAMGSSTVTDSQLRWAFGILLSRSFALPTSGNGPPPPEAALLPFCDFLNHSPAATNFVTWDSDNRQVVLSPDRNYEAKEQIFVSYGEKSSGMLLLSYGFVPDTANRHDAYTLRLRLDPTDPQCSAKAALLQAQGLQHCVSFPIKLEGWPVGMLQHAAFIAIRTDSAEALAEVAADLLNSQGCKSTTECNVYERIGVSHVMTQCKAALGAYRSSMQSDRALEEDLQSQVIQSSTVETITRERQLITARIRIQERRILQRTIFMLSELRRKF